MDMITLESVSKSYQNGVPALSDVTLHIQKGEFVFIVGDSGSGKSTLLHMIGAVDRPTSGKIYLDGQDVFQQNNRELAIFRRRQVGLIYQFYNLIPVLTAEENITLPILMDGRKPDREHLEKILGMLGLKERRNHLPSQMSGGQQQRVSIARAIVKKPKLILADEPTAALDYTTSIEVLKAIEEIVKNQGTTVMMVTHNPEIAKMANRVVKIRNGKIASIKKNMHPVHAEELVW